MAVTPFPISQESDVVVARGSAPQVYFHGWNLEAQGGEVRVRARVDTGSGFAFYSAHLQDGESRADPPFSEGIICAGDLYIEIEGGENLVVAAVFARTGS